MRVSAAVVIGVVTLTAATGAVAYARWPTEPLPSDVSVDSLLVLKAERKLILLSRGTQIRAYEVSLGRTPVGPKTRQGDGKTPEGSYVIDYRNEKSTFHLALHVSYPNETDRAQASTRGEQPGGLIMVHGMRNHFSFIGRWHRLIDWTDGCIAVTDEEIDQIARVVKDGTRIEIRS